MEFYREYNPGFEYYFDHGPSSAQFNFGGGLAVAVTAILLAVLFAVLVFAAATYVLRSIGLYTMAKNRGIENAWLAWVPVGNSWLLGQIADEVNSRQGKKTNYSLILLVLTAVTAAGGFSLVLLPFSALLSAPLSLAASVVYFIALYDVYQDYAPKNAVVFLVLSILLSAHWLLLFILRDRLPLSLQAEPQKPAEASTQQADPGWQPVEYTPQPQPAPVAQPACGWSPDAAPQQTSQPAGECPPEHWGGIMTVEQPPHPTEQESDFPQQ